jgi:Holliday junction resolvasome RuvABC endonuclease subunit
MLKILGIDASTRCSGYCLINENGELLSHSTFDYKSLKDIQERIDLQIKEFIKLFKEEKPDICYIENTWNKSNIETTKALTNIIGAIRCLCIGYKCGFNLILPSTWRSVIGIDFGKNVKRDEFKKRAIEWVNKKYNLNVDDDEAEAICIAYAGNILNNKMFEEEIF